MWYSYTFKHVDDVDAKKGFLSAMIYSVRRRPSSSLAFTYLPTYHTYHTYHTCLPACLVEQRPSGPASTTTYCNLLQQRLLSRSSVASINSPSIHSHDAARHDCIPSSSDHGPRRPPQNTSSALLLQRHALHAGTNPIRTNVPSGLDGRTRVCLSRICSPHVCIANVDKQKACVNIIDL